MSARDGDLRGLLVVSRFDVRVGVAAGYVTRLLDEAAKLQGCPKAI